MVPNASAVALQKANARDIASKFRMIFSLIVRPHHPKDQQLQAAETRRTREVSQF